MNDEPHGFEGTPLLRAGYTVDERYVIRETLGVGGMGTVYLAEDTLLGDDEVAIKILHPQFIHERKSVERFLREVRLLKRLQHPNIVRIYDAGNDGKFVYFTMECCRSPSLGELIDSESLPLVELPNVLIQICEGLNVVHGAEIIHRDLKPDNILVLEKWKVKLTDFGIARPINSTLTDGTEFHGSVEYTAPEVWSNGLISYAVDLYGLGVVLYELLTSAPPFESDSIPSLMKMHLEQEPVPPREKVPSIPEWANDLTMMLLEKEPAARPMSAYHVADFVRSQLEGQPIPLVTKEESLFGKVSCRSVTRKLDPDGVVSSGMDSQRGTGRVGRGIIRRLVLLTYFVVFLLVLAVGFVGATRYIPAFNDTVARAAASWERKLGTRLTVTRRVLALRLELSTDELFARARLGDRDTIRWLLAKGLDPNIRNSSGDTPLLVALREGNHAVVEELLASRADAGLGSSSGKYPLFLGIDFDNPVIIEKMLRKGAGIEAVGNDGMTPLLYAVRKNKRSAVRKLLDFNADIFATDRRGMNALAYAWQSKNPVMVELITQRKDALVAISAKQVAVPVAEAGRVEGGVKSWKPKEWLTRLRIKGKPKAVWRLENEVRLKSVEVKVQNHGEVAAEEVKVYAVLPGRGEMQLDGERRLKKKKYATYSLRPDIILPRMGDIEVRIDCLNCRR